MSRRPGEHLRGPHDVAWMVGALAAALTIRFATLGTQSFWFDEGQTVELMQGHLGWLILHGVPHTQNFPPLYFVIAWLWVHVFSLSEVGLRSLSALCGALTVPVAYGFARELGLRRGALALAGLVAASPLLVWYSQEARPYALLVLLGALSLLTWARARNQPSGGRIAAWALSCALAVLTHYFAAFLVAGEAVVLLTEQRRSRALLAALSGLIALCGALLPLALHQRSSGRAQSISATPLWDRARVLPNRFLLGEQGGPLGNYGSLHALLYPLAILALIAVVSAARSRRQLGLYGWLLLAAAVTPIGLALIGYDYVADRNLIVAWLPFGLIVAAGLTAFARAGMGVALTAAFAALSLAVVVGIDTTPRLQRDDWRGAAQAVCLPHPERALVVDPFYSLPPLRYYLPGIRPLDQPTLRVSEIDVIAVRPTGPPRSVPGGPGAWSIRVEHTGIYLVVRLLARHPVILGGGALAAMWVPTQGMPAGPALLLHQDATGAVHWTGRCRA